jgi:hypothetical protein
MIRRRDTTSERWAGRSVGRKASRGRAGAPGVTDARSNGQDVTHGRPAHAANGATPADVATTAQVTTPDRGATTTNGATQADAATTAQVTTSPRAAATPHRPTTADGATAARTPGQIASSRSGARGGFATPATLAGRVMAIAAVLAALVALNALAATASRPSDRVAVVMDSSVAHDPARRAAAEAWLRRSGPVGADRIAPRVPTGPTQELSVTSALATRGYDTIVAIGVDRRVAIDPVVQRHADVRVISWPSA